MKYLLIFVLSFSTILFAGIEKRYDGKIRQNLIRISNERSYAVFCEIWDDYGYYKSFYVRGGGFSLWYIAPRGKYKYWCE